MDYLNKKNIQKLTADDFWVQSQIAETKLRVIMRVLAIDTIQWNKSYDSISDSIDNHINTCLERLRENESIEEAQSYSGFCKVTMFYHEDGDIEIEYWFPLT